MISRIIGTIGGDKPGPLVVATAALHGNEPAGVQALEEVFRMLNAAKNLDFKGRFVGLIGNLHAYADGKRFVGHDFNRVWGTDYVNGILQREESTLQGEDLELFQLYHVIKQEADLAKADKLILLDLHTTSAGGGIFCIPTDESESLELAKSLHAPAILSLFEKVQGTLLRFASEGHFDSQARTLGVAYEAGQHDDPLSVSRSLSAILNTLHFAGCISDRRLRNPQETILQKSFAELPRVTRLVHAHHIAPGDNFKMRPGYINFQAVREGEHLADDVNGAVITPFNSLILMPLYQAQGSDGFFLVKEEEGRQA